MLGTPAAPQIETARLILRGWRPDDFAPYAAMLAEPGTSRYITRRGRPYGPAEAWAEMAFLIGHWQVLGHGMFVVEERSSGRFVGRVGTLHPCGWPACEVGWALSSSAQGQGYATEAAQAVIGWAFGTLLLNRVISIIHPDNLPSQRVARRLGERQTQEQFAPFGEPCDIWEITNAR